MTALFRQIFRISKVIRRLGFAIGPSIAVVDFKV